MGGVRQTIAKNHRLEFDDLDGYTIRCWLAAGFDINMVAMAYYCRPSDIIELLLEGGGTC